MPKNMLVFNTVQQNLPFEILYSDGEGSSQLKLNERLDLIHLPNLVELNIIDTQL